MFVGISPLQTSLVPTQLQQDTGKAFILAQVEEGPSLLTALQTSKLRSTQTTAEHFAFIVGIDENVAYSFAS